MSSDLKNPAFRHTKIPSSFVLNGGLGRGSTFGQTPLEASPESDGAAVDVLA